MTSSRIPTSVPTKLPYYIAGGFFLLIFASMFRPFVIVNAGERGVVMQFGKVQDRVLDEGLHAIMPGVDTVKKINIRVQKDEFTDTAASSDLQQIRSKIAVNWRIEADKVNDIYQQVGDEERIVISIINPAVSEVLKAATAKKTAEQIITERNDLKNEIDEGLQARLSPYGLAIDNVSLIDFSFSEEFAKAIEAKQIAEQEAKRAVYLQEKANREIEIEVSRAKGQAEAQKVLRENLTPELLQKQAIDKWDG
ncbi:MAG: prohibitin family protein, partial [Prochloraceae cyanobacterium]|nr:prohibitin family protein [Prochloraceae cyanobacterium]